MNPCSRGATSPLGAVVYVTAPRPGSNGANIGCNCDSLEKLSG